MHTYFELNKQAVRQIAFFHLPLWAQVPSTDWLPVQKVILSTVLRLWQNEISESYKGLIL